MRTTMRRDTAGFIMACIFVGLMVLDAACCQYMYWTYGWVAGVVGALLLQQVLLIAFVLSWQYIEKNCAGTLSQGAEELSAHGLIPTMPRPRHQPASRARRTA
jgi:hypothetical protein